MKIDNAVTRFFEWFKAGTQIEGLKNNPDVPSHVRNEIMVAQGHAPQSRVASELQRIHGVGGF